MWMLVKSLYGLKQSGQIWNCELDNLMASWGFHRILCEWCVYMRTDPRSGDSNIVVVHVDDMICAAPTRADNEAFKAQLQTKWEISDLGNVKYCLGIGIIRDPEQRTINLSQTALIDRLVTQFFQSDTHPVSSPMDTGLRLRRPTDPPSPLDAEHLAQTPYRSLVGGLMYLAIGTRADIAFPVNHLTGFLDCYRFKHWRAAIQVLQYLNGTRMMVLRLGGMAPISLSDHVDADSTNELEKRKSVMGHKFSLGSGAILWASRKQKVVTLSSTEAEYIGASEAAKEVCWLRMLLRSISVPVETPTLILCDNDAARILAADQMFHARAKHIDNRYHHIRDCIEKKNILTTHFLC
jgi:hypothetical protein